MRDQRTATLQAFLIALAVWIVGMLVASQLVDATSKATRAAAVIIGLSSAVPWARIVIGGIREADEYTRRVHVLGICIGFGGVTFTIMAVDWIQRAGFIGPVRLGGIGLLVVVLWWGAGMFAASRYYR